MLQIIKHRLEVVSLAHMPVWILGYLLSHDDNYCWLVLHVTGAGARRGETHFLSVRLTNLFGGFR